MYDLLINGWIAFSHKIWWAKPEVNWRAGTFITSGVIGHGT